MRPLLTDLYPRWWYNRMRSSSWNAPAVSVLLGLIGGFAEPRMDARGSHLIPNSCSADCSACDWECPRPRAGPGRHTSKTSLWPCRGCDLGCKCILAYLVGESTCQFAECSPSGLFSAELDSQWASKSGGDLKSEGFMLWNKQVLLSMFKHPQKGSCMSDIFQFWTTSTEVLKLYTWKR